MPNSNLLRPDELLCAAQFHLLVQNASKLYLTVIAIVCFVVWLTSNAVSPEILAPWCAVMIVMAFIRGWGWRKLERNGYNFSPDEIRARLATTERVGILLIALFSSVGLFVVQAPDLLLRTTTMLALWGAAIGTAVYLFVLPRVARKIIIGATICVCATFLYSGGRTLIVATPMFAAVGIALLASLQRNFITFKAAVETQAVVEAMQREAMQLAMTDPLTSLPNRRAFEARLAVLSANAQPFALALVDLDGFKPINDTYGHAAGDKALILVAQRLRSFSDAAFVARLGGDEFALLIDDAGQAECLLREAVDMLTEEYVVDDKTVRMGASCGLAFWRHAGDEAHVLAQADAALYVSKQGAGPAVADEERRNRVQVFQDAA